MIDPAWTPTEDFDPDDWRENFEDEKIWQINRPTGSVLGDDEDPD